MKVTINIKYCNECPFFRMKKLGENRYDLFCTHENTDNTGSIFEEYNEDGKISLGDMHSLQGKRGIPLWCPFMKNVMTGRESDSPKFKAGDWVVYSTGEWREVLMVETVDGNGYGMIDKACEHISIGFEEEIYMRLWRISDARAGDVLASEHFISVFKEIKGNVSFSDYVTYSTDSCILFRGLTSFNCDMFEFKPATVEQRRMLEDKFEKEGLVWDGYRKELMRKCL